MMRDDAYDFTSDFCANDNSKKRKLFSLVSKIALVV